MTWMSAGPQEEVMDATGKLHKIFEAQQVTERFRKREFVLELEGDTRYPQTVLFQLTGRRCEILDDFAEGDELRVEFALRGREWTSPKGDVKFFNSLEVFEIARTGASQGQSADQGASSSDDEPPPLDDDDLPF